MSYGLIEMHPSGAVVLRNPDGSEALRFFPLGGSALGTLTDGHHVQQPTYGINASARPVEGVAIAHAIGQWMLAVTRDAAQNLLADMRKQQTAPAFVPAPYPVQHVVTTPEEADLAYGKASGIGDLMREAAKVQPQQLYAVVPPHDDAPESQRASAPPVAVDDSAAPDEHVPEDTSPLHLPDLEPDAEQEGAKPLWRPVKLVQFIRSARPNKRLAGAVVDDAGYVTAYDVRSYVHTVHTLRDGVQHEEDEHAWRGDIQSFGMLQKALDVGGEQAVRAILGLPSTMTSERVVELLQAAAEAETAPSPVKPPWPPVDLPPQCSCCEGPMTFIDAGWFCINPSCDAPWTRKPVTERQTEEPTFDEFVAVMREPLSESTMWMRDPPPTHQPPPPNVMTPRRARAVIVNRIVDRWAQPRPFVTAAVEANVAEIDNGVTIDGRSLYDKLWPLCGMRKL